MEMIAKKEHIMRLHEKPFLNIKNGLKKVEFRLLDKKRSLLKVGDNLKFISRINNEEISTKIKKIRKYKTFSELYDGEEIFINKYYKEGKKRFVEAFNEYYPLEEQKKFSVLSIELDLIK